MSNARGLPQPPISPPSPVGLEPYDTNAIAVAVAAIEMHWRSGAPSNTTASMKVNHGLASCLASPATGHAHHRFGQVNDLQAHFAEPIPGTDQVVQARSRLAAVRDRKLGVVAYARTLIRVSSGAHRTAAIGPRSAGSVLFSESKSAARPITPEQTLSEDPMLESSGTLSRHMSSAETTAFSAEQGIPSKSGKDLATVRK